MLNSILAVIFHLFWKTFKIWKYIDFCFIRLIFTLRAPSAHTHKYFIFQQRMDDESELAQADWWRHHRMMRVEERGPRSSYSRESSPQVSFCPGRDHFVAARSDRGTRAVAGAGSRFVSAVGCNRWFYTVAGGWRCDFTAVCVVGVLRKTYWVSFSTKLFNCFINFPRLQTMRARLDANMERDNVDGRGRMRERRLKKRKVRDDDGNGEDGKYVNNSKKSRSGRVLKD